MGDPRIETLRIAYKFCSGVRKRLKQGEGENEPKHSDGIVRVGVMTGGANLLFGSGELGTSSAQVMEGMEGEGGHSPHCDLSPVNCAHPGVQARCFPSDCHPEQPGQGLARSPYENSGLGQSTRQVLWRVGSHLLGVRDVAANMNTGVSPGVPLPE